jgi:hypothetical protein
MKLLADSRLGDSSFSLSTGKMDIDSGELFTIRCLVDPKYHFTMMRDKGPTGETFHVVYTPAEMLYTQINKGSDPFEESFRLLHAWLDDLETEFYHVEDYKQTVAFRDQFLKAFQGKYGGSDETFDPAECVLIDEKLRLFEAAIEPQYRKEIKFVEGEKTLRQQIFEILIDANIFSRNRWVQIGGSKIFYLIKRVYKNIAHNEAELEAGKKLIEVLLT